MMMTIKKRLCVQCLLALWLIMISGSLVAAPEWQTRSVTDLLKGEQPFEDTSFNVGPTGFRGWVFRRGVDSSESRQILVKSVETNSPADGILAVGDVILGVNGDGGAPTPFQADARRTIAGAIMQAEARDPATLGLLRWRNGQMEVVTLTLETMGAYAPTAPYHCEKSRKILRRGAKAFFEADDPGMWHLGILFLLAADDPTDPDNDRYQDKFGESGEPLELVKHFNLDAEGIIKSVEKVLGRKKS